MHEVIYSLNKRCLCGGKKIFHQMLKFIRGTGVDHGQAVPPMTWQTPKEDGLKEQSLTPPKS